MAKRKSQARKGTTSAAKLRDALLAFAVVEHRARIKHRPQRNTYDPVEHVAREFDVDKRTVTRALHGWESVVEPLVNALREPSGDKPINYAMLNYQVPLLALLAANRFSDSSGDAG